MKKKWVILPIETKAREFESRSLLAYQLVKKGYGVICVPWVYNYEKQLPKGIWFVNNLFKANYSKLKRIKDTGSSLYVVDEEGLLYINEDRYLGRIFNKNFDLTDKFFCYGNAHRNLVSKKFPGHQNKLVNSGNPRINFLNRMFDTIDEKDVENIRSRFPDMILVVSNFTIANIFGCKKTDKESRYKAMYSMYDSMNLLETEDQISEFNSLFSYIDEVLFLFIALVKKISELFPDSQIVIRPHPSENHDFWRSLTNYKNVYVVYEGNLTSWIKASKIVIQQNCTSAIESLFLDKPCVSYRPVDNEEFDQPLTRLLSINMSTEDEILGVIRDVEEDNLVIFRNKYPEFIKKSELYISNYAEDLSIKEIINTIDSEAMEIVRFNRLFYKINTIAFSRFMNSLRSLIKINIGKFIFHILSFLQLKNVSVYKKIDHRLEQLKQKKYWRDYEKQKRGIIHKSDFIEIFEKYSSIYNENINIKVKSLEGSVFMFY